MAELSAKEKLYAKHWGWKDNGDGTLTTTNGRIYDHEAGLNYSDVDNLKFYKTPLG